MEVISIFTSRLEVERAEYEWAEGSSNRTTESAASQENLYITYGQKRRNT